MGRLNGRRQPEAPVATPPPARALAVARLACRAEHLADPKRGVPRRSSAGGGTEGAISAVAAGRFFRHASADTHHESVLTNLDLVAIFELVLRDPFVVNERAVGGAHVDNGIRLAITGNLDHGVDTRNLGVVELQMRRSEATDLDDVAIEFLLFNELFAFVNGDLQGGWP